MKKPERNMQIFLKHKKGAKVADLARLYSLSKGRVRQIIDRIEWEESNPHRLRMQGEKGSIYLSVRTMNCLTKEGIEDLDQLSCWTEKEILKFKNLGRKSVDILKMKMRGVGYSFNIS